jgi:hypothetical protein
VRLSPEKFGAKIGTQKRFPKKGFCQPPPRPPVRVAACRVVRSIFYRLCQRAACPRASPSPDPPPDDATWRACAPKWRLCPASCPPQSRTRRHPSRGLEGWPYRRAAQYSRSQTAQRGHELIRISISIYIDFCEAQSGSVRDNNERQITIAGAPQKHGYSCNSKRPSTQPWGAQRS